MSVPLYIARRYLFARKSRLIQMVSGISVLSITVGTAALILVLSVFNGLSSLIQGLYNRFDPDLKIEALHQTAFSPDSCHIALWRQIPGVLAVSTTLQNPILIRYNNAQRLVTLKGVDQHFALVTRMDTLIVEGHYSLNQPQSTSLLMGYLVAASLGISTKNPFDPVECYAPKKGTLLSANPNNFSVVYAQTTGLFSATNEYDDQYVLCSLPFAQHLLDAENQISSIEIACKPLVNPSTIQDIIQKDLGPNFAVKTRFQQQETVYKMMQSERLSIILILSFVLLIATFNMIAALMMIIYDKRRDLATLQALGLNLPQLRRIFVFEGLLIALFGGCLGITLGGTLALLQQHFGWIKLGQNPDSFVVNAYPVNVAGSDCLLVLGIVLVIGLCSALIPSLKIKRLNLKLRNQPS